MVLRRLTDFAENLPFPPGLIYNLGMENELDAKEAPAMQMDMPNLPWRVIGAIAITLTGYLAVTGAGGWMLYQSAIAHMNTTAEVIVERITERLEPKIDANGERIDELSGRVERNGELIAQLGERMTAVEIRVGALVDIIRYFHPAADAISRKTPESLSAVGLASGDNAGDGVSLPPLCLLRPQTFLLRHPPLPPPHAPARRG